MYLIRLNNSAYENILKKTLSFKKRLATFRRGRYNLTDYEKCRRRYRRKAKVHNNNPIFVSKITTR